MISSVKQGFIHEVCKHFSSQVNMEKRIDVVSDLVVFIKNGDPYLYAQNNRRVPEHFNVYIDGTYICGFSDDETEDQAMLAFWKGLREAYKRGDFRLNQKEKFDLLSLPQKPDKKEVTIEEYKPKTEVEAQAKKILLNVKNKKGKK